MSNQIENINIRTDHHHIDILYSEEYYKRCMKLEQDNKKLN